VGLAQLLLLQQRVVAVVDQLLLVQLGMQVVTAAMELRQAFRVLP
jgi:hypothetical protein